MKEIRKRSLSVKLSDDEENDLYEVTEYLHDTKKYRTLKRLRLDI